MTRVLSSACVVVLLLVMGGNAWAGPKPTIAILGLEVVDSGTGIDPETTRVAKDLTAALRSRAELGTPYVPAPNGNKELIDEKLLNNCDTEAPSCMAAIGTELGAEVLMFGKIEKHAVPNTPVTYQVSLKLLYVSQKQVSSLSESLPQADAAGIKSSPYAKTWYGRLVGVTTGGAVAIKANIDRGTVIIDEEKKGSLTSGMLSLTGVAEGRHTLAIEAQGYQRYETSITVRNGETLSHTATMVEQAKAPTVVGQPRTTEGTVSQQPKRNIWKPIFYGSAAIGVGAGIFSIVEWRSAKGHEGDLSSGQTNSNCGDDSKSAALTKACTAYHREIYAAVIGGVFGAVAAGAAYMAFFRERDSSDARATNGPHKKRREFAVTPIVSPDGGGATLRIDW